MSRLYARIEHARRRTDAGFTLVEMLVATVLVTLLGGSVMTMVLATRTSTVNSTSQQDLNEEARLGLNRMARELRQATAITNVLNPDGASYSPTAVTAVTFTADFNGDGCIDGVAPGGSTTGCTANDPNNPETLTYCWDPTATVRELFLIAGTMSGSSCNVSGAQPILAGQVSAFKLSYRSNLYLYDANNDGITTWSELDAAGAPVGNSNGQLDSVELPEIDTVVIDLTAQSGSHVQTYTTQVDLRNLS